VERGVTADPTDSQTTWSASCTQATAQAQRIGNRGRIGGLAPLSVTPQFCSGGACSATCPDPSGIGTGFGVNPQVSVEVTSTPLPLFFAKIFGSSTATVAATGLAEAFNPSGTDVPVASKGVVPWMLPNMDPGAGNGPIFDVTSGQITNNIPRIGGGGTGFVGETFTLANRCLPGGCGGTPNPPVGGGYYPLDLPNTPTSLPNCSLASAYHENIAAYNPTSIACGGTVNLENTGVPVSVTNNQDAINCRIGATAPGLGFGQDVVDTTGYPYEINAGSTHNGVAPGTQVSTTRSVVTIPVYDSGLSGAYVTPVSPVTVIGFVQALVLSSDAATGEPTITVLNVSACSAVARASTVAPVGANEGSSVPVRLIHN